MKNKKETQKQARVLEYRAAISKRKSNPIVLILDFLLLGALVGGLYLGFTNFGDTLSAFTAHKTMRYVGLAILGGGFLLSYVFSFIFHKSKNSQNLRDRAWMFFAAALAYFGYMAIYYFYGNESTEPLAKLLPTLIMVLSPFAIAFLAGRGHASLVGFLGHLVLIAAYVYATYLINYVSPLTSFHNVLLLARDAASTKMIMIVAHDGVFVASLLGTAHFMFLRHKFNDWQNVLYFVAGLLSIAHVVFCATELVTLFLKGGYDIQLLLNENLIPAVAAVFSLVFGFIELFTRDIEKKRPLPFMWAIIPLVLGGAFFAAGFLGVPYLLKNPMFQADMYVYIGYALIIYLFMFSFFFILTAINMVLRYNDEKWRLNKKAHVPAENRAVYFVGNSKPNSEFIAWSKAEPNKLARDNKHLFVVDAPDEYTVDAKKQIFLRYVLALVDVFKKDYRLLYNGKVYYASPKRVDPQTGRPVVSLESDSNGPIADRPLRKAKAAPIEEVPGVAPKAQAAKKLAPAPKAEPEVKEEVKPAGPNKVSREDYEDDDE